MISTPMQDMLADLRKRREVLRDSNNGLYFERRENVFQTLIAGTRLSRDMSALVEAALGAKTLALPDVVEAI